MKVYNPFHINVKTFLSDTFSFAPFVIKVIDAHGDIDK